MQRDDEGEKKKLGIRICSTSNKGDVFFGNLTNEEQQIFQGMVFNHYWVTVQDGRLAMVRRREEVPGPVEDEEMFPFWRRAVPGTKQLQLFDPEIPDHAMPSIIIQHLCGYGYTPDKYVAEAKRLERYGFDCLRSRRGVDSRYWEVWILSGLWSAKEELKAALGNSSYSDKKTLEKAVSFLRRNVAFGTLDVSFQKAAMTVE